MVKKTKPRKTTITKQNKYRCLHCKQIKTNKQTQTMGVQFRVCRRRRWREFERERVFFVDFLVQKMEFDSCQAKNFCRYATKWGPLPIWDLINPKYGCPQSEIWTLSLLWKSGETACVRINMQLNPSNIFGKINIW